jgi:CheY-like chemotaxis protein
VVIVDLGLPDGSGLDLIDALARQSPRVPAIIATSGDPEGEATALAAGADRFLAKPIDSLASFQDVILTLLPDQPRATPATAVEAAFSPDPVALRDDLTRAALLLDPQAEGDLDYVARFLSGLALSAHDPDLRIAAEALLKDRANGPLRRVSGMVQDRLAANTGF